MSRALAALAAAGLLAALAGGGGASAGPLPQRVVDGWSEGNHRYQAGDYAGALEAYGGVFAAGYTAPELEYNAGNAALKAGRLGPAVLHYRRAVALRPTYESALENLSYARSLTQDVKPAAPSTPGWGWLGGLRLGLGRAVALVVGFGFLLAGIAVVRLVLAREGLVWVVVQGAAAGALLLASAALLFEWSEARARPEGVVMTPEVEVRTGPGETQTVSFRLHEGTEVDLLRRAGDWHEVRVSDGLEGWVPADAVEAL